MFVSQDAFIYISIAFIFIWVNWVCEQEMQIIF